MAKKRKKKDQQGQQLSETQKRFLDVLALKNEKSKQKETQSNLATSAAQKAHDSVQHGFRAYHNKSG